MGGPIFARELEPQEQDELDSFLQRSKRVLAKRAIIILLSSEERYRVSEIAKLVGMHASSVRYWIHRFNDEGMAAIRPRESPGRGSRVHPDLRGPLIQLAETPPREPRPGASGLSDEV